MPITMLTPNKAVPLLPVPVQKAVAYTGEGPKDSTLVTTYTGRVLSLREVNGPFDSDFIATVWGYNDKPIDIEYMTTRGWTYANHALADATPEIKKAYLHYTRHEQAMVRLYERAQERSTREKAGLTYRDYKRLKKAYRPGTEDHAVVMKLLQTRRFRSDFRHSLALAIRAWMEDDTPKYRTPITAKQLQYLY